MGDILGTFTDTIKSLPKAVVQTVKQAPAAIVKAPVQAIRDTVHITSKPRHTEVNRRQVTQAARNTAAPAKTKPTQKPRNIAAPVQARVTEKKSAPMSLDVIKEMSPAKQRAYFNKMKGRVEGDLATHARQENKRESVLNQKFFSETDQTSVQGVTGAWNAASQKVEQLHTAIHGTEGVKKAEQTARDLESKRIARFEKRLEQQNPERYAQYKQIQQKDERQLASEADSQTWKRRDLQLAEEERSRRLLAQDPNQFELSERHQHNVRRADKSIVDGHFREAWHQADESQELRDKEKKALPNKAAWLKSLSPQQRTQFLQKEQHDNSSILNSAVARRQNLSNISDALSLGTGKMSAEDGVLETFAEAATLGTYSAAKAAGTDLGRGSAYADHSESLKESGLLNQAHQVEEKASELRASGGLNLAMATASAVGLGTAAHKQVIKQLKKRLPKLPSRTVTVATQNRAIAGTTRAANPAVAEAALSFDDVADQAARSGLKERLDVACYDYVRQPDNWWKMKLVPEWDAVSTVHHINVHGAEREFAERLGQVYKEMPDATYQGVRQTKDIHVGDFAEFLNPDGTITRGLQGSSRVSTGEMILNRRTIDAPINAQMHRGLLANGRNLSRGQMNNLMTNAGFQRERSVLMEVADDNLRNTVWHETAHFHDNLLGVSKNGRYRANVGPAYSNYAAETGSAAEDLAEGYAHVLSERRRILLECGDGADWTRMLRADPVYGPKNGQILDTMVDNVVHHLNEII